MPEKRCFNQMQGPLTKKRAQTARNSGVDTESGTQTRLPEMNLSGSRDVTAGQREPATTEGPRQ